MPASEPLPTLDTNLFDAVSDPTTSASESLNTSTSILSEEITPPTEAAPAELEASTDATPTDSTLAPAADETEADDGEDPPQMASVPGGGTDGSTSNDPTVTYQALAPKVDKTTGALVQDFPLSIPPGRDGLQPHLALSYNSQQLDESIVGYGWSINVPYIERINRQGTNKMYSQDYFYSSLGGSGELASTSIANEYRAKIQNGNFLKYAMATNTASTSWTVYDKEGTKYTFGVTSQARLDNNASTTIYRWMLEEVRDTNNNYIKYEYVKDNAQIYPATTTYTGNGSTDGAFTIVFTRESRPDVITSYRTGFLVSTNYRISRIEARVNATWVQRYDLAYTSGNNTKRSLLQSVTQSGQDETGAITDSLPALSFQYANDTVSFTDVGGTAVPETGKGWVVADVHGDGFVDVTASTNIGGATPTYINRNNGSASFSSSYCCNAGVVWAHSGTYEFLEQGARFFDVNGDGKADGVYRYYDDSTNTGYNELYLNNGNLTWTQSTTSATTPYFSNQGSSASTLGLLANLNGDGITDFERAAVSGSGNGPYFGTGSIGFATGTGFSPVYTIPTRGTADDKDNRLIDINGDGLDDWVAINTTSSTTEVRLNNGAGWESSADSRWTIATTTVWVGGGQYTTGSDRGMRFVDLNGDGLLDFIRSYKVDNYPNGTHTGYSPEKADVKFVMLNTGSGWATSSMSIPFYILEGSIVSGWFEGFTQGEMWDWSGDGLPENGRGGNYKNNARRSDMLATTTYPTGGYSAVTYSSSSSVGSNNPFPVYVVSSITNNDANGHSESITYTYSDPGFYFNGPYDRKNAGFQSIKESHADKAITDYYHQGNTASTTLGEFNDHVSKIGKVFREDVADTSNNTYKRTFYTWDRLDQGNDRNFVHLSTTTELTFDGDATHKDLAAQYTYATSTGDLTRKLSFGEVSANTSGGSFTDTGTDIASTTIFYAASTSVNMSVPYQETTENQSGTKTKESRYYYDNANLGSTNIGNLTKRENWITGSSYASSTRVYNSYGLPTQDTDPRSKNTTYTYDSLNIYVATATNPLSQNTGYVRDYSSGKTIRVFDPNSRLFETLLDPLDRLSEEKQPDITTPTTLVTKAAYAYTENSTSTQILKTSYLNSATSSLLYSHLDGLGRLLQTRKETGGSNTYAVKDYIYDTNGRLAKESLPYFASSTAVSVPTTNANLLTTYAYDALDRVTTSNNALGTTTNSYNDWTTRVTDPLGSYKNYVRDAYSNLINVGEYNAGSVATTTYEYDRLNNLTKITDPLSSIRNFTYDALSRRLTAEDLHAVSDTTYGTSTYTYDVAGNLTSRIDPNGKTISYTYDDINRVLTEDDTSQSGTEVSYGYDSCANGADRLCSATSTAGTVVTNYVYNALGGVSSETKKIGPNSYSTSYDYDRQGNNTLITYPDGSQTQYVSNDAGRIGAINHRNSASSSYAPIITTIYYSPLEQPTFIKFGNGIETVRTYDANKLYRLTNILTTAAATSTTGQGSGGIGGGLGLLEDFARSLAKATTKLPLAIQSSLALSATTSNATSSAELVNGAGTMSEATTPSLDTISEEPEAPPEGSTRALLVNKSAGERATIKGQEIARRGPIERTQRQSYEIEVVSIEAIEGGVQAYVRAWNQSGQIGFGTDGSVDMERFRVFNPPILVPDPQGDIIQTWTDRNTGELQERRLREDPKEALLQVIEHNLSVMSNIHGSANIEVGKRGNTTSTFYPDANPESTSVDGDGERSVSNPGESFSTLRSSAATAAADSGTVIQTSLQNADSGSNKLSRLHSIVLFDTSALGDSDTISSATFSLYGHSKGDGNSAQWSASAKELEVVSSNPASNTSLGTGDFDIGDFGTTELGVMTYSSFTASTYNDITLNADGRANISKVGVSKFGTMLGALFDNTDPGAGAASASTYMAAYAADQSGTSQDPKLVVEHTSPVGDPTVLQDMDYVYDAVGNITSIAEAATSTGLGRSISYTYDNLNRLISAIATSTTSSLYQHTYTYNAIGNITNATSGTANTHALDLERSSTQYAYRNDASALDITGNFTLEAWIKPEAFPAGDAMIVMGKYQASGSGENGAYGMQVSDSTHIGITIGNGGGDVTVSTLSAGTWYHVAAVYKSSTKQAEVFLNGASQGSTSPQAADPYNNSGPLRVGSYAGATATFDGVIDDVRVWNVVRTSSDISSNKNAELVGSESGLVAYYKLNDTYDDETTNTLDLTAVNSPVFSTDVGFITTSTGIIYSYVGTSYANPHAVTSYGSNTHTYDQNGNLLTSASTTNTWDWRNRLTRTVTGTTGTTTNYLYDENDMRVQYNLASSSATTTIHYPNKLFNATLFDWPGTTTATTTLKTTKHIFLGDLLVATIESATSTGTTTYYMHTDHIGGTNVVTNASGTAVELADYLPYGGHRIHSQTGSFSDQRKFAGTEFDPDSAYSYMQARYYDSGRGQFISQDPVFLAIGAPAAKHLSGRRLEQILADPQVLNSYSYGRNNPITMSDPTGQFAAALAIPLVMTAPEWLPTAILGAGTLFFGTAALLQSDGARWAGPRQIPSWEEIGLPQVPLPGNDNGPMNTNPNAPKWMVGVVLSTMAIGAATEVYERYKELEDVGREFREGVRSKSNTQNDSAAKQSSSAPPSSANTNGFRNMQPGSQNLQGSGGLQSILTGLSSTLSKLSQLLSTNKKQND